MNFNQSNQFKHFTRIIATLLGLWFFWFLTQTLPRMAYPFFLDPCEAFSLNRSLSLAKGETIYKDVNTPPFFLANYPPVYEYTVSFFISPQKPSFFPGRLLSYLSQMAVLLITGLIIYHRTRKAILALIGAGSITLTCSAWMWSAFHRVDMLGLFFNTLGVWLFLTKRGNKKYWSIPFFLLAGYTKQVFIAAPLACALCLYRERPRKGWIYFSLYGSAGILIYLLACLFTEGHFFHHTLYYNFTPLSYKRVVDMSLRPLGKAFGLWLIILTSLILKKRRGELSWDFLSLYGLLAYGLVVLTAGKIGSSWNYFLELGVVMALLLGDALFHLLSLPQKKWPALIGVLLLAQLAYSFPTLLEKDRRIWDKARAMEPHKRKLLEIIRRTPGEVLEENLSEKTKLPAVDTVVLGGKRISLNIHYYLMMQGGLFNRTSLDKAIGEGRYSLIILDRKPTPAEEKRKMVQLLDRNYTFDRTVGPFYLYRKK